MEQKVLSFIADEMPDGTAKLETVWQNLTKLNILFPCNLEIEHIGINLNELIAYVQKNTCTQILTAALFLIAKT